VKISVGLPSRGRPLDMVASAVSLFRLASGGNDICVFLNVDNGDRPTIECAYALQERYQTEREMVLVGCSDRHAGLGELHNHSIALTYGEGAWMMWSDRISVITPNWDHEVAMGCLQYPNRPIWLDSIHLAGPGQIILPPAWRAAQGGPCFPGIYPFWFDDTHQEELDALVHGPIRVALASKCAGPRTLKTNRCRDVEFWVDVFAATRPQRVEQARGIADRLGVQMANPSALIAMYEMRDADMRRRAAELQAQFGEAGEPDASYLEAKARAEFLMTPTAFDNEPLGIEASP
jgi:hypothetical protein